jgi:hypothetical protein
VRSDRYRDAKTFAVRDNRGAERDTARGWKLRLRRLREGESICTFLPTAQPNCCSP